MAHHTRKTHNAHNETQRRLSKTEYIEWYKKPSWKPIKDNGDIDERELSKKEKLDNGYYRETRSSNKKFKKFTNRILRRTQFKKTEESNIINNKVKNKAVDPWG